MRPNIGVIFGGKSVEHEISILSAVEIMSNMDQDKYNVIPIYIDKENNWYCGQHLKDIINYRDIALVKRYATKVALIRDGNRIVLQKLGLFKRNLHVLDFVFPIGHGAYLEDGSIQGYLNMIGVDYAQSGVLASAVGMDKVLFKDLLKANDLPTTKYMYFYDVDWKSKQRKLIDKITKEFSYPLFVKPASLGSSIGISKVSDKSKLVEAIELAVSLDRKVLIEECVPNTKEVNISVLGDQEKQEVSDIEEINVSGEFYSFKEKYVEGYNKHLSKKDSSKMIFSKELIDDIKSFAIKVFKLIDCRGVVRIDFLLDDATNKVYINEINTIPGDLACYIWLNKKKKASELIENLINISINYHNAKKEKIEAFNGNLLEAYDILDGKKIKNKNKK